MPSHMHQSCEDDCRHQVVAPEHVWPSQQLVSVVQVNAELIVTFEGTTEFGNPFMARQSYLPTEIHWGHKFISILQKPPPGHTHYTVDISK